MIDPPAGSAAEVRDDHDRELQPLGGVNGHDPYDIVAFFDRGGLGLVHGLLFHVAQPVDKRPEGQDPALFKGPRQGHDLH